MKISEQDLEEIFKKEDEALNDVSDQILVKRAKKTGDIRNVRKTIRRIKTQKPKKETNGEFVNSILRFLAISGFSGFVIFIVMSSGALYKQLEWSYFVDFKGQKPPSFSTAQTPSPTPRPVASSVSLENPTSLPTLVADFPNNNLKIEKIAVSAPVAWNVGEEYILDNLKRGVAHYEGTSLPGGGGNIFIVGHSSNYFWVQSDYNTIFALLDKLEPGDRIELSKDEKNYIYEVKEKKTVNPNDVQVLYNTPKETLTLMTCWPIGTSLQRLLVQAELLYSYSGK